MIITIVCGKCEQTVEELSNGDVLFTMPIFGESCNSLSCPTCKTRDYLRLCCHDNNAKDPYAGQWSNREFMARHGITI